MSLIIIVTVESRILHLPQKRSRGNNIWWIRISRDLFALSRRLSKLHKPSASKKTNHADGKMHTHCCPLGAYPVWLLAMTTTTMRKKGEILMLKLAMLLKR